MTLRGKAQAHPPFWLMRQAGRYLPEYLELRGKCEDFLEFCQTATLAMEATLQPVRRFRMDAAILFSDILVVPHALGCPTWFEKGIGPRLTPVSGPSDIKGLRLDGLCDRLAGTYETVRRVRDALCDEGFSETALIGFAGAPWTVATYMVEGGPSQDFARVKAWAYGDAEGFQRLIDILIEASCEHLLAQVEAGAEAIQLFDSWAGVLSESQFERWVIAPTRTIVGRLKAVRPDLPVIGFPRGAGPLYQAFQAKTGVDAVSIDTTVPPHWAAEVLQPHGAVQGNLDPHMLLVGGRAMESEARRILRALAGGPFVFNLGHGILPETPPGNVAALAGIVRNWTG